MCTISIALIANACKRVWLELFEVTSLSSLGNALLPIFSH